MRYSRSTALSAIAASSISIPFGAVREPTTMVCDLLQKIEMFHAAGTQMTPAHGPEIVKTFYDT